MEPGLILSCGHPPTPTQGPGTGVAFVPGGKSVCYTCSDELTRKLMATGGPVVAYLSGDGKAITTWSGGKLADITWVAVRRVGFNGAKRTYWHATDATGKRWHGQGAGVGMVTTMRGKR